MNIPNFIGHGQLQHPRGSQKTPLPPISRRLFVSRMTAVAVIAIACSLLSPVAKAADAAPAPAGVYTLAKIGGGRLMSLGTMEIKGQTYRVNEEGKFAPFTQDGAGNITWSAGLDILPEGWKLGKSTVGKDEQGRPLIKIHYTSPRGAAEVIDAVKEK